MGTRYRVALQGFGAFERQALESYFRLAERAAAPRFEPGAALADCDLCVVDVDRPGTVDEVRLAGRMERSVFVGTEPPQGAIVHLGRPINPRQVARALETLLLASQGVADPYAPAPPGRAPKPLKTDKPVGAARKPGTGSTLFPIDVLVFEDGDVATSALIAQLERLGCRVSLAIHADEAPRLLAQSPVRMVFCDMQSRGTDGLALCQQIKSVRKGAPSVVLMGPRVTSSDRVRAQLAGADALLAKPIDADALLGVLQDASNRRRRAR